MAPDRTAGIGRSVDIGHGQLSLGHSVLVWVKQLLRSLENRETCTIRETCKVKNRAKYRGNPISGGTFAKLKIQIERWKNDRIVILYTNLSPLTYPCKNNLTFDRTLKQPNHAFDIAKQHSTMIQAQ